MWPPPLHGVGVTLKTKTITNNAKTKEKETSIIIFIPKQKTSCFDVCVV